MVVSLRGTFEIKQNVLCEILQVCSSNIRVDHRFDSQGNTNHFMKVSE